MKIVLMITLIGLSCLVFSLLVSLVICARLIGRSFTLSEIIRSKLYRVLVVGTFSMMILVVTFGNLGLFDWLIIKK